MGYHKLAVVEDVMAHKSIEKLGGSGAEGVRFVAKLLHGLCQAMRELYVAAFQCLDQFHIVVARQTECLSATNHRHYQTEHAGCCGAAVDKIAHKDEFASVRRDDGKFVIFSSDGVAKLGHQLQQLIQAAMHIANDVEWPVLVPPIVPKRCALDGD